MSRDGTRPVRHRFLLLTALRWLPEGLLAPVYVLLALASGADLRTVGFCVAAYGLAAVLLEVPSGALADAVGRRPVLLTGALLQTAHATGLGVAEGLPALLVVFGLGGASRALLSGPLEAWWVDTTQVLDPGADLRPGLSQSGAVEGGALAAGALAAAAVPLLAATGLLDGGGAGPAGLGAVAVVAALAGAVHLVALAALVPRENPTVDAPVREAAGPVRLVRSAARTVARDVVLRRLALTALTLGAGHFALEVYWQPRLQDVLPESVSSTTPFGLLIAAAFLVAAAASAAVPRLSRGRPPAPAAAVTQVAFGAGLLGLALVRSPLATAVLFLLAFAVLGAVYPLRAELLHARASAGNRATLLSVDSLTLQAGGIVASAGLGALVGAAGIPAAWCLAGVTCAAGALLLRARAGGTDPDTGAGA